MLKSQKLIIGLIITCFSFSGYGLYGQEKIKVIVDADTGNEVDDLFALARIIMEPSIEITALNAAHWQTSLWAIPNTMENSHRLNQQLLGEMDAKVKTVRGANARMYDWGDRAQHSAAAYEIISQAEKAEQLNILALGALTNVASAVYIRPEIAKKITVYWLGTTMDFDTGVLKRNDFNPLMDPFALDMLLDSDIELVIMPINIAVNMEIMYDDLEKAIGSLDLGSFLLERWDNHLDGSRKSRILWDLALVSAFIEPELARTIKVKTSRDSGNREINFYDSIDAKAIYQDFFKTLLAFSKE
ncbi:nucleoside hydrolase [Flagellimonas meridianipacifica]|uniref:Inosine-uridine nucleoside N-ribohydrolase n=1 Tax=Flagellimonas meridianipacifica TaxID=1080225 RepID=A0A2T0MB66_9FLAO|nr:nucleoside hydrolase [Allomuricauda pacifica]PRX54748.1 inosine-uridine nucleoside N-ribohydrolase [Allomuricauda pacifica]